MMQIISRDNVIEMQAYDNVINALVARFMVAMQNRNDKLANFYKSEIDQATKRKREIMLNFMYGEPLEEGELLAASSKEVF